MSREDEMFGCERDAGVLVVMPHGDSLSVEERSLRREIADLFAMLDGSEIQHVVVDIGNAPYFGSLVIGAVIGLCKKANDNGGKSALCNASPGMRESLEIMKIDEVIPYYPTRAEALESVRR